jgi:integrase
MKQYDSGAHCKPQLPPLVITALHTQLRAWELRSLIWNDVDFRCRTSSVRGGYAKNVESRTVPMNEVLTTTLKIVKLQSAEAEKVSYSRQGTPYHSFRTTFERAMWLARLADGAFHELRHTFASRLVMAGVDFPTVKELLGHKDISVTVRHAHLSSDHKQATVKKLEKVPAIFTTPPQTIAKTYRKCLKNTCAPVAQADRARDS